MQMLDIGIRCPSSMHDARRFHMPKARNGNGNHEGPASVS